MSDNIINPVIIFGAKGLGKTALEIFKHQGIVVYGFLDDDTSLQSQEIDFVSVLGKTDDQRFLKLIGQKCDAFVASDENVYRESLAKMLIEKRKVMPINAVHPTAFIASSASIGHGNLVNMGAMLGADSHIRNLCILHSGAIVEHEVKLGNFIQIGANSTINAGVEIGTGAFIGSGVTIVAGIKIGKNARVGAGSVVIENVGDGVTVFGNPAQKVGK